MFLDISSMQMVAASLWHMLISHFEGVISCVTIARQHAPHAAGLFAAQKGRKESCEPGNPISTTDLGETLIQTGKCHTGWLGGSKRAHRSRGIFRATYAFASSQEAPVPSDDESPRKTPPGLSILASSQSAIRRCGGLAACRRCLSRGITLNRHRFGSPQGVVFSLGLC